MTSETLNHTQQRVVKWMRKVFGENYEASISRNERVFRFLEEALELTQATETLTKEDVLRVVEWVYSRPKGETPQEVAGTLVTLLALSATFEVDAEEVLRLELDRVETPEVIAKIRSRQADKNQVLGLTRK